MTKKEMGENIMKVFGNNHAWTYQFFSSIYYKEDSIVKFYYDRIIASEKDRVEKEIEKLQKRLDDLNKM